MLLSERTTVPTTKLRNNLWFLVVCITTASIEAWVTTPNTVFQSKATTPRNEEKMIPPFHQRQKPSIPAFMRRTTRLYLEDWVANMIDGELYRQQHKKEYEEKWMAKNRQVIMHHVQQEVIPQDEDERSRFVEHRRDIRMAAEDPRRYCADRCITTGNCDVFEDIFDMTPEEVVRFCKDCVMVDEVDPEHDHCDIPEGFYRHMAP